MNADFVEPSERAHAVSPSVNGKPTSQYTCYVDLAGKLYNLYWSGAMQHPGLSHFPIVDGAVIRCAEMSTPMAQTWRSSQLVDYGANACIRTTSGLNEVLKLAHPNLEARTFLRHEFEMLTQMVGHDLPIPRFDPLPLMDGDGIYGYKLERLIRLEPAEETTRAAEMRTMMVEQMHRRGFVHGDFHPSNVMKSSSGELVVIDFGFSGVVDDPVPGYIPAYVYNHERFHTGADEDNLQRFLGSVEPAQLDY